MYDRRSFSLNITCCFRVATRLLDLLLSYRSIEKIKPEYACLFETRALFKQLVDRANATTMRFENIKLLDLNCATCVQQTFHSSQVVRSIKKCVHLRVYHLRLTIKHYYCYCYCKA